MKIHGNINRLASNRTPIRDSHILRRSRARCAKFLKTKCRARAIEPDRETPTFRDAYAPPLRNFDKRLGGPSDSARSRELSFPAAVSAAAETRPFHTTRIRRARGGLESGFSLGQVGRAFVGRAHDFRGTACVPLGFASTAGLAHFETFSRSPFSFLGNAQGHGPDRARSATLSNSRRFQTPRLKFRETRAAGASAEPDWRTRVFRGSLNGG